MPTIRGIDLLGRHERAFEIICGLENESFNEFVAAFTEATNVSPVLSTESLSSRIVQKTSNVKREDSVEVLMALMNLHALLLYNQKLKSSDLIENIRQSVEEDGYPEEGNLKTVFSLFKTRLETLLNVSSYRIIVKAINLLRENTNMFSNARTVTDIRPVFDTDLETNPVNCAVLNTLKLSYITNGELQEFFISMDDSDINLLLEVLNRAKKKTETLKLLLKDTKLSCVDTE